MAADGPADLLTRRRSDTPRAAARVPDVEAGLDEARVAGLETVQAPLEPGGCPQVAGVQLRVEGPGHREDLLGGAAARVVGLPQVVARPIDDEGRQGDGRGEDDGHD